MDKSLIYLGLLAGIPLAILVLRRWERGIYFLAYYVPFSGLLTLYTNFSPLGLLLKDFAFIAPTYVAFFSFMKQRGNFEGIPRFYRFLLIGMASMIIIEMFNPSLPNFLVALIGAKVWLYYIPMIFIGYALMESREKIVPLLRVMVVLSIIPCAVGLIQWIGSTMYGYELTMKLFYGKAAAAATQDFARFNFGTQFFRIPSTFSFAAQYYSYLLLSLVTSYSLITLEQSNGWKRFAQFVFLFTIVASLFCGARSAYIYVPVMCLIAYSLHRGVGRGVGQLALVLVFVVPIIQFSGIDLRLLLADIFGLTVKYGEENTYSGLMRAFHIAPFGVGTGMNTIASRYALTNMDAPVMKLENWYGKSIVELGIVGFLLVVAVQFSAIVIAVKCARKATTNELRGMASILAAFFLLIFITNVKDFRMDYDPINIFYWLFIGFLCRINYLVDAAAHHSGLKHPPALSLQDARAIASVRQAIGDPSRHS